MRWNNHLYYSIVCIHKNYVDMKSIWHRLMKREPVRLGDQSLQKCFMDVLFKICSANVFLVFIFPGKWVL